METIEQLTVKFQKLVEKQFKEFFEAHENALIYEIENPTNEFQGIFKTIEEKKNDICVNCLNNKPGQINICHCTFPYLNQTTY